MSAAIGKTPFSVRRELHCCLLVHLDGINFTLLITSLTGSSLAGAYELKQFSRSRYVSSMWSTP